MDKANLAFRREIAAEFAAAIVRLKISKKQAALDLGVSRETLYQYLRAKSTPGGRVLRRACEKWGITLSYRGLQFTSEAFEPESRPAVVAYQLPLFAALDSLTDRDVTITVVKKSAQSVQLKVNIRFSSGEKPSSVAEQ